MTPEASTPAPAAGTRDATATAQQDAAAIHSDRRLPSLTGLRIFAAVAVYLSHIGAPHDSGKTLTTFLGAGYSGVTLFFVLSGFVLSVNYFEEFRRPHLVTTWNFFVARFARIYPLYIVCLAYVVIHLHAYGFPIDGWWRNALAIQAWSPNVLQAFSFDGPAWSLSVEFFLYACFPLLVPLIARMRRPRTILVTAALIAAALFALAAIFVYTGHGSLPWENPSSAHRWLYRTPFTRLGDFALGILAARLFVITRGDPRLARIGGVMATGAAVVFLLLMAWPAIYFTAWSWDAAYAVPTVLLIFGLSIAQGSGIARFLSIPAIVLLGEASFAFYLVHQPMIGFLGGADWDHAMSPTAALNEIFVFGAILALALGLHIGLELPARKRLRRWLSRPERERPAPAEAPAATANP
jgi:peptidoglycan/LPS O-acetylase OafA/YrhL